MTRLLLWLPLMLICIAVVTVNQINEPKDSLASMHTLNPILGPSCPKAAIFRTGKLARCDWYCGAELSVIGSNAEISERLLFVKAETKWRLLSQSDFKESCNQST